MFKSGSILGFEWFWPIPIVGFLMSLFALLSTCWGDHHRFTLLGAWFLRPDLPFLEELSFQPQGIPCNPKKIVGNGWLSVDRSKTRNVDGAMLLCPWKIERRLNKWAVRKKKTEKHGWDCSSYPSVGHTKGLHPGSWHPGYIIFSIKRIKFKQKTCRGSKPVGPE